jgi:hypothetical protein
MSSHREKLESAIMVACRAVLTSSSSLIWKSIGCPFSVVLVVSRKIICASRSSYGHQGAFVGFPGRPRPDRGHSLNLATTRLMPFSHSGPLTSARASKAPTIALLSLLRVRQILKL